MPTRLQMMKQKGSFWLLLCTTVFLYTCNNSTTVTVHSPYSADAVNAVLTSTDSTSTTPMVLSRVQKIKAVLQTANPVLLSGDSLSVAQLKAQELALQDSAVKQFFFEPLTGKSFLNEQFTLKNIQSQRNQRPYQIIHLATHGEFQPGAASDCTLKYSCQ